MPTSSLRLSVERLDGRTIVSRADTWWDAWKFCFWTVSVLDDPELLDEREERGFREHELLCVTKSQSICSRSERASVSTPEKSGDCSLITQRACGRRCR